MRIAKLMLLALLLAPFEAYAGDCDDVDPPKHPDVPGGTYEVRCVRKQTPSEPTSASVPKVHSFKVTIPQKDFHCGPGEKMGSKTRTMITAGIAGHLTKSVEATIEVVTVGDTRTIDLSSSISQFKECNGANVPSCKFVKTGLTFDLTLKEVTTSVVHQIEKRCIYRRYITNPAALPRWAQWLLDQGHPVSDSTGIGAPYKVFVTTAECTEKSDPEVSLEEYGFECTSTVHDFDPCKRKDCEYCCDLQESSGIDVPDEEQRACRSSSDCNEGELCVLTGDDPAALAFTCAACEGGECPALQPSQSVFVDIFEPYPSARACAAAMEAGLPEETQARAHAQLWEGGSELCGGAPPVIAAPFDFPVPELSCGSPEGVGEASTLQATYVGYALCAVE